MRHKTGLSQSIIQYWVDRPTTHIPGSWTFIHMNQKPKLLYFLRHSQMKTLEFILIFINLLLKNSVGTIIPDQFYDINEHRVNDKIQYRINFKDGKKMNQLLINSTLLPTITFYRYIGERLSLSYIQGSVSKLQFEGSSFSVDPNNTGYEKEFIWI